MRILAAAVTARGHDLARRLPYEVAREPLPEAVRSRWADVDAFVLVAATGIAVRTIGPLLTDKLRDPAVVCVDDAGRFAVALAGGHARGANGLARRVAALIGARPVVTTASDADGRGALDGLTGFHASGDVAGVTRAWLDGTEPVVENPLAWPLPALLREARGGGTTRVVVTDKVTPRREGTAALHPPSLVLGVGSVHGADPAEVRRLADAALGEGGLATDALGEVATIDRRGKDAAGWFERLAVRAYSPEELAVVAVPNPSEVVRREVGTPSVAEAAALRAAGSGAELVVTKRRCAQATVAVARRRRPRGRLALVGLGPGHPAHRTPAAVEAVRSAQVVVGYARYLEACGDLIEPGQEVFASAIGHEVERARLATAEARRGRSVAVVCSGDSGVYAMASLALEALGSQGGDDAEVSVVPGVTAGLAASAALGAPLGNDHAYVSLSDHLTPWPVIEARLEAAGASDLVVVLYNPRSARRPWQLEAARKVLLAHRPEATPVGVVTDVARSAEVLAVTTLGDLDPESVGMTTCVIVGSASTYVAGGHMITPRGYHL